MHKKHNFYCFMLIQYIQYIEAPVMTTFFEVGVVFEGPFAVDKDVGL